MGDGQRVVGVQARGDVVYRAAAVVLTTGTFLQALMHTGETQTPGGRGGEGTTPGISRALAGAGLSPGTIQDRHAAATERSDDRLRADGSAAGRRPPAAFFVPEPTVWTWSSCPAGSPTPTTRVHELIRANLHRAPMYSGQIQSSGPRYCPSIEDKVVRFADKEHHQLFLEPEGRNTHEVYVNGVSTSLPRDVQDAIFRLIPGLGTGPDHALRLRGRVRLLPARSAYGRRWRPSGSPDSISPGRSTARPATKRRRRKA